MGGKPHTFSRRVFGQGASLPEQKQGPEFLMPAKAQPQHGFRAGQHGLGHGFQHLHALFHGLGLYVLPEPFRLLGLSGLQAQVMKRSGLRNSRATALTFMGKSQL